MLAPGIATSNASSDAHYEALRRAYDERVKSLSRKLRSTSGGEGSSKLTTVPPNYSLEHLHPPDDFPENDVAMWPGSTTSTHAPSNSASAMDQLALARGGGGVDGDGMPSFERLREEQIDTLVEKMGVMSDQRAALQKHNAELKSQLEKTSTIVVEQRRERERLEKQIADVEKLAKDEREFLERQRLEDTKRMQDELSRAHEKCELVESENGKLKQEITTFERRLEKLQDERKNIQQEVITFSKHSDSISTQLKQSQDLLKQSELERQTLRDQYVNVGEKFERLMDLEEKENVESLREISMKLKATKNEKEKLRKRTEKIIADLEEAYKGKDVECERLQGLLDEERAKHQESEQQMLEAQRKTLHEHNLGLAKLSEMMPITSHQQILEETRRHHQGGMLELEQSLRQQYQKQLQQLQASDEKKQKEFQDTLLHVRTGLKKLEAQRDDAVKKGKLVEDEALALRAAVRKVTSEKKDLEESKRIFSASLEEANSNLTRLRGILEDEKQGHLALQRETHELKRRIAIKDEFLQKERGVLMDDIERTVGSKLKWAEEETERLLSKTSAADAETDRLRQSLAQKDAKIIKMLDERSELEKARARDQAVGKRAVDLLLQAQQTTKLFAESTRRELAFLKKTVADEVQALFRDALETRLQGLQQAIAQHSRQQERGKQMLRQELETHTHTVLEHKQQYQDILTQQKAVNKQFDVVTNERNVLKQNLEKAKENARQQELNIERILSAIVAGFPALEENKDAILRFTHQQSAGGSSPSRAGSTASPTTKTMSELIKDFRAKIQTAVDGLKKMSHDEAGKSLSYKLKNMEDQLARELSIAKEVEIKSKTDHERQLAEYAVQLAELRGTVSTLEERYRQAMAKAAGLEEEARAKADDMRQQQLRLQSLEQQAEDWEAREAELRQEGEVLVELAKTEAVKPVKEQMKEVFKEAEKLQQRFAHDLAERDRQWEGMFEDIRKDSNQILTQREKEWESRSQKLEQELELAREREQELTAEVANARHEAQVKQQNCLSELDQATVSRKRMEHELEQQKRELKAARDAGERERRTLKEALELKNRLAEELQRENKRLQDERDEEIAKVTELKEDELARLQSVLKTQYAKPRTVQDIVSQQEKLEQEAESLSMRVQEHLSRSTGATPRAGSGSGATPSSAFVGFSGTKVVMNQENRNSSSSGSGANSGRVTPRTQQE